MADDPSHVRAPAHALALAAVILALPPAAVQAQMIQEIARLTVPDAAGGDELGGSVSIDGDTVVVGAPYDDGPEGTCGPTCDDCACCPSSRVLDFAHPPATPIARDLGCVDVAAPSPELLPLPDDIAHVPRPPLSQQPSS